MSTKKKLALGFDIDGVVADFVGTLLPLINAKHGTSYTEMLIVG